MIKITSPAEIYWKSIDNNELVTEFLTKISNLLINCEEYQYHTITLVIDLKNQLSMGDLELVSFALKYYGWKSTNSFRYDSKLKRYDYTFSLKPII